MYGLRGLLHGINLAGIIVNSGAAKEIMEKELGPLRIIELFHPVLPVHPEPIARSGGLRIGTFGIPSGSKKSDLVVSAFQKVRQAKPDASLVVAGFQAAGFAASRQIDSMEGIEVYDSPTDQQFDSLLASVDVAVQLRSSNLGESSGPVARLLYLGKPIIVSRVGAFSELEDAVAYFSEPETPERLAELIISASMDAKLPLAALRYCESKSPAQFCARLRKELGLAELLAK
jgi:glycosyltransferase involved in cell wall biosynthesis